MREFLNSLLTSKFEIVLLLAGVAILLVGSVNQLPAPENNYNLKMFTPPNTVAVLIGGILTIMAILLFLAGERRGIHASDKEYRDLIDDYPKSTERKELQALATKGMQEHRLKLQAQAAKQKKKDAAEKLVRDHQLIALIEKGHLDPVADNYAQRVDDRFLAIGTTNKDVVKTIYKYCLESEIGIDLLWERHKRRSLNVQSTAEMYHRVVVLAFLSLVEIKATGNRNTVVRKIEQVHDVLTTRKRLDS